MARPSKMTERKAQLVDAAIAEIGAAASLDVTVSQIARRAGVSPALAHHYFGTKEAMFLAAMRHILSAYGAEVRERLTGLTDPRARIDAIIDASFGPANFDPAVVSAWLNFYVAAQTSEEAARLLRVYAGRLRSNLMANLVRLTDRARAEAIAECVAALIDGFYIRQALHDSRLTPDHIRALIARHLDNALEGAIRQ